MITVSQSFKIYELLNKHFKSEEDAKALVEEIEKVIDQRFEKETNRLATKQDLAEIKTDMIKWMVGFWLTQMAAIIALFIRK